MNSAEHGGIETSVEQYLCNKAVSQHGNIVEHSGNVALILTGQLSYLLARNANLELAPKWAQFHNSINKTLSSRCSIICVHFNRLTGAMRVISQNCVSCPLQLKYPCLRDSQQVIQKFRIKGTNLT